MRFFQKRREETGKFWGHAAYPHAPSAETVRNRESGAIGSSITRFMDRLESNCWLMMGMTLGITALIIGWWIVSGQEPDGIRLFNKPEQPSQQTDTVGKQTMEQLEVQLTVLIDRVEMLTNSINYMDSKLIHTHALIDSISTAKQRAASTAPKQPVADKAVWVIDELPPPAAGQTIRETPADLTTSSRGTTAPSTAVATTDTSFSRLPDDVLHGSRASRTDTVAVKQPTSGKTLQQAPHTAAVTEYGPSVSKHQTPVNEPKAGPWIINLTSSSSQAVADRFAANAQSRGIETRQQQVTVKGKHYWRVQTTGFSSAAEAKTKASQIKEKLGLKDVWIVHRIVTSTSYD